MNHDTDPVAHIRPLELTTLDDVTRLVLREIQHADELARAGKFGGTHVIPGGPDSERLPKLVEEVGEVATAMNEIGFGNGTREVDLLDELIDTAALATGWAAAILERRP